MLELSMRVIGTNLYLMNSKQFRLNVGTMVINFRGQVLACQRVDNPTIWQLPQGGVASNEKLVDAAYRELKEETGIVSARILASTSCFYAYEFGSRTKKSSFNGKFHGQKQKWFLFVFLGEESEINVKRKNREFLDWKWIELDQLATIGGEKSKIYTMVLEEFRDAIKLSKEIGLDGNSGAVSSTIINHS